MLQHFDMGPWLAGGLTAVLLATGTSADAGQVIVSELMYNPPAGDEYEFIELANIGNTSATLSGARFSEGISYTFGATVLLPGELIVVARDPAAFTSAYGTDGIRLAPGSYSGKLDNAGEQITLVDALDQPIAAFKYDDGGSWPSRPDGLGSSLEVAVPGGNPDEPDTWTASRRIGGSPGLLQSPTPPPVVINEVLPHTDPPYEDAIELFNTGNDPVDLGGWYLSDSTEEPAKYRIPAGTTIAPLGYAVFYELQFNTNNTLVPFALSSPHGDEVVLTTSDAHGNPAEFVDTVSFGPSLNGLPFGRWPNGTGELTTLTRQTLGTDINAWDPAVVIIYFRLGQGAANAAPRVGPIVITEIMYHPPEGGDEYLQLANIADTPTPLFDPLNPTNLWQLVNGVQFTFPANTTLEAGERILLTGIDPGLFRILHGTPAETRIFGPWTGNLDNAGEAIEIAQPDAPQTLPPEVGFVPYVVVERVRYDNHAPWPTAPDGEGDSLVRLVPDAYGNDPTNWAASSALPGIDTDSDGMPDAWEEAHSLNPDDAGDALLDADSDGATNLDEYRADTDPRDPASRLAILSLTVNESSQAVAIRFHAAEGRAYRIDSRIHLQTGGWELLEAVSAGAAREVLVTDSPPEGAARFYRLVLVSVPSP